MKSILSFLLLLLLFSSCFETETASSSSSSDDDTDTDTTDTCLGDDTDIADDVPDWIKNNFRCVTAYMNGTDIYIETDSVPDHTTAYWGDSDENFEDMPSGHAKAISEFLTQSYQFIIPETPTALGSPNGMFAGAIGISVDGVVFFKGQTSTSSSLSTEWSTFDTANAHPNGGDKIYHYHGEPAKITDYETSLVGILADGYPIYGPLEEDGSMPGTGSYPALDSDTYGHEHATADFPSGTFHYHLTEWDGAVSIGIVPLYFHGLASPSDVTGP